MEFIVWGAGQRGKHLRKGLGNRIIAFIDSDIRKIGENFCGLPVISLADYLRDYSNKIIIIANAYWSDIVDRLESNGVHHYLLSEDLPSELQGYGENNLHDLVASERFMDTQVYLYGLTAYSLILMEMLSQKGKNVYIIPHYGQSPVIVSAFQKIFNHILSPGSTGVENLQRLYLAVGESEETLAKLFPHTEIIDIYDFPISGCVKRYTGLEKLKGVFSEKERCFIVATGPSLKNEDLKTLEKHSEICIGVNGILFHEAHWKPDIYVAGDAKFLEENKDTILNYRARMKFLNDIGIFSEDEFEHFKIYPFLMSRERMCGLKFSEDIAVKTYAGVTVTYVCIQIAVYMGFRKIYLLGVDANYSVVDGKNHFYGNTGGDNCNHRVDDMIRCYETARRYADAHGIQIYNATRGGRLEVFPRVDFDSLF